MEEQEQDNPTTSTKAQCSECGTDVPADAPLGLCPACLLKRAMLATTAGLNRGSVGGGFEPPDVAELKPLFPHLEVLELIGRGGMGAVYKAVQIHLDRFVAIKILPTSIADDPAFAERFAREARSLARLNHANIVTVHDFGRAGPYFFFVMEFVDGANLRQALLTKSLEPKQALAIVPQICDALQYAHDEGIVHRDIKPENVLLDKKGRVKIADFGLAKLLQKTPQNYTLTQTHVTMGTPQYMAPEQTEHPTEVDHRADIYSLGVVFYEMLTGELPLGRFAAPSQKAHVDARLDEVVFKTLEKEPARRYQQASEVKTSVQELSNAPTTTSIPTQRPASPNNAQPVLPYADPSDRVHHSRTAWVGAILGAVGVAALALVVLGVATIGGGGFVLMIPLMLLVIGALVAMPLCGLLAISQIHRANGRLGSLRLALFDAIAIPMFFMNAIPMVLFARMLDGFSHMSAAESLILMAMLGVPVCVVVDFFLTRYLWRRVSAGLPQSALGYFTPLPAAPKPVAPAMSGITYSGPGRYSRTAIAGAVWGSLAIFGPACVLVASYSMLSSRTPVATSNFIITAPNAVSSTPFAPSVTLAPSFPGSPIVPTAPRAKAATPATRPTSPPSPSGANRGSGGSGGFGGSGGSGMTGVRVRPTTRTSALETAVPTTRPEIVVNFDTAIEPFAGETFNVTQNQPTTRNAQSSIVVYPPTTRPWNSRGGFGGVTVRGSSGGGAFGGTSTYSGTISGSGSLTPITVQTTSTSSFWNSISGVARLLVFPVLALSLTAPVGATILGMIAISQIRRSNGALYGMPLAVTDALFFPLLLLDTLIIGFVTGAVVAVAGLLTRNTPDPAVLVPVTVIGIAVAGAIDVYLVRRALRAAQAP